MTPAQKLVVQGLALEAAETILVKVQELVGHSKCFDHKDTGLEILGSVFNIEDEALILVDIIKRAMVAPTT